MDTSVLDLEVDVNGEAVFAVNKSVISSYSGKIWRLLRRSSDSKGRLKVIFKDFPGGADCFEQILQFCYKNGEVNVDSSNIAALSCAAYFMEMTRAVLGRDNLCEKTEKSLDKIQFCSWHEGVAALKQCQHFFISTSMINKLFDSVVARVAVSCETSPCSSFSSSDTSGFRLSCDTRSTESSNHTSFQATWWFEDLVVLKPDLIRALVKLMVSRNIDNGVLARFLFYYHKSTPSGDRIKITETVIDMLNLLDVRLLSHRSLFRIMRDGSSTKIIQRCRRKLENMLGSQLDRATLDSLLVSPPRGSSYAYDVHLVLRLLQSFLKGGGASTMPVTRLKKVAELVDMYLMEVAPDPCLEPSVFAALVRALPVSARESMDRMHDSVNLYLEVHSSLSCEEKMEVSSGLNYQKVSADVSMTLKGGSFCDEGLLEGCTALVDSSPTCSGNVFEGEGDPGPDRMAIDTREVDLCGEGKKLRSQLKGMQWRALELEKVCNRLDIEIAKMVKSATLIQNGC